MQRISAAIRPALGIVLAFACAVSACTRNDNVETGHRDAEGYLRLPVTGLGLGHTCVVDATLRADITYHDVVAHDIVRYGLARNCRWENFERRRMTLLFGAPADRSCATLLPDLFENPSPNAHIRSQEDLDTTCYETAALLDHHRLAPPEPVPAGMLDGLRQTCFKVKDYDPDWAGTGLLTIFGWTAFMLPVRYVRFDGPLIDIWMEDAPHPWNASPEDVLIEASHWNFGEQLDAPNLELRDCAEAIPFRESIQ